MQPPPPPNPLASADSLAWINARVAEDASLTRFGLAREACVRLNLRDAKGRPREMACRKQLLTLQRRGQITLPPPRHKPPSRRPPAPDTAARDPPSGRPSPPPWPNWAA